MDEKTNFITIIEKNDNNDADGAKNLGVSATDQPDTGILPLRGMVMYPDVVIPITVQREKSLRLVKEYVKRNDYIGVFAQRDAEVEDPGFEDLYETGTLARIIRVLEMPDGTTTAILHGVKRAKLKSITATSPTLQGDVRPLREKNRNLQTPESEAMRKAVIDAGLKIIQLSQNLPNEMSFELKNSEDFGHSAHFIAANFPLTLEQKQKLIEISDFGQRTETLLDMLTAEIQLLEIKAKIQHKAHAEIDKQQREYFLNQQIKAIQNELGDDPNRKVVESLREKGSKKKWNDEVKAVFEREVDKLARMNSMMSDYSVQLGYVEELVGLPWDEVSEDNYDLKNAQKILDRDHFGLKDVKERIVEYLAVVKLKKGDLKSPILCLYGPPGVGKTSLGKSVAESLGREYVRMSLGGLHDEAEIRGHRRTYIGAMPGRIIQGIKKAGTSNPVFILDEIDKLSADAHGDPSSALLEVLDPEQNNTFHDNFLDVDYDLSKVLFIATANNVGAIPKPLLDRMELIEVNGYTTQEKVEIATRHLIPKELGNHGLKKYDLSIGKQALTALIEGYTRESGVRDLERKIAKICRRVARNVAEDKEYPHALKPNDLKELVGTKRYEHDEYDDVEPYGVVTGLAWTSVGGEILQIEVATSKSKNAGKLSLTGNLGDVMKESGILAMEYIKSHAEQYGLNVEDLEHTNVHLHVPEGAVPKDGPSAGITITTALLSALTHRKVKPHIAMTGEITLRGRVLPVGGIKEKILAAKRAGITTLILCEKNRKDIEEIEPAYIKGLTFNYVKMIDDVIGLALENAEK